jgi:hypothetical protein
LPAHHPSGAHKKTKELSALRDGGIAAAPKTVLEFPGAVRSASAGRTPVEIGPEPVLVVALNLLDSAEGIEPEMLSSIVCEAENVMVSAQWLSKKLKPLGIQAKKHNGRRVFMPSKEELQKAQSLLGIATPTTAIHKGGQQGHDGQQNLMKEVI